MLKGAPELETRHKPGHVYTSPEVYELEKERIFKTDWLNVCRADEIPEVGDYLTLRIADEPVLVVRAERGELVALANVCAHRGVAVASGEGHTRRFACPYHGWVYGLDGRLEHAAHLEKNSSFDVTRCRLPRLHLDTWGGFVFVTLNPNPKPLLEVLGDAPDIYAPYRLEDLRMAHKFPCELAVNWKLLNENLCDIYHLAVLHNATVGPLQPKDAYRFEITDGGYHGRFHGGTLTSDGKSRVGGPIPWLPEELHDGGFSSHIPPNMGFFPRFDCVGYTTTWPIEVDRCVGWNYLLFPADYFERPGFMEAAQEYADFFQAVLNEDIEMMDALQKGLKSDYYARGPLSPFEAGVASLIKHNIDDIGSGWTRPRRPR